MKNKTVGFTGVSGNDQAQPNILEFRNEPTSTIDLHSLFTRDLTSSGSFDIRNGLWATTFGKLIQALPIPAMLVDKSQKIMAANQACGRISKDYESIIDTPFWGLFPDSVAVETVKKALEAILLTRRPKVCEAVLRITKSNIWSRMTFRSIRIVSDRHIMVLIEDLTAEKRRLLGEKLHTKELEAEITRRHKAEAALRHQRELLEERVKERTAELLTSNLELTREIAERRKAEDELTLARRIIEGANEAVIVTDPKGTIVDVNEALCKQCGYSREELLGGTPKVLQSGKHSPEFYRELWQYLISDGEWQGEVWGRHKNGELYPKLLSISSIKDASSAVTHYVGFSSDISKIKQTEEKLQQLAHFDQLTGLANRVLLRDRLERAVFETRRTGLSVALMILDLDRFKEINDTLGHPAGDEVLKVVSERLTDCVRESDTVGRLGGDEFTIILPRLHDTREVETIAKRVMGSLEQSIPTASRKVFVSTSMGIALCPSDAEDADKLLQNADTALYRAKDRGKNNFQFFSEEMNRELVEKIELELALRNALQKKEFQLFFQPIIDFSTGTISSAESLLRWRHESLGWVQPEKIIRLAEESGLILNIGEWVLYRSCQQSREWQKMGLPPLRLAVNVSGHQLNHSKFVCDILRILRDTGADPSLLELELTESVAMSNLDRTEEIFRELRSYGIKIAVDDFGTGYSSLSYLKRLAVDKLKVDRSFVQDIASDPANRAIVSAIVAMGHSLGLKVLAEGIESREQLGNLWSLDCDEWQGFLFSRPVPAEKFQEFLRTGRKGPFFNFGWTPELSVHVDRIDEQHRVWCKRVTDLCKSLWTGIKKEDLCEFMDFLSAYSRLHFEEEEHLMQEIGYPEYESHMRAHVGLAAKVDGLRDKTASGGIGRELVLRLTTDLYNWFVHHIRELDRDLGEFVRQAKLPNSGSR